MKYAICLAGVLLLAGNAFADDDPPAKLDGMRACRADVKKLCPDVQPGGGRIVACLKQNMDSVSPACKEKLDNMHPRKNPPSSGNNQPGKNPQ